jgi:hypothetical protein
MKDTNCGVKVAFQQISDAHALDKNVIDNELECVEPIQQIIEIQYSESFKPVLFKCKWFETFNRSHARSYKGTNFLSINSSNCL